MSTFKNFIYRNGPVTSLLLAERIQETGLKKANSMKALHMLVASGDKNIPGQKPVVAWVEMGDGVKKMTEIDKFLSFMKNDRSELKIR